MILNFFSISVSQIMHGHLAFLLAKSGNLTKGRQRRISLLNTKKLPQLALSDKGMTVWEKCPPPLLVSQSLNEHWIVEEIQVAFRRWAG